MNVPPSFRLPESKVAPDCEVTVTVDNQDQAAHNFAIFTDPNRQLGEIYKPTHDTQPGQKFDYAVQPLKAGTYYFECFIHPSMNGTVSVK